VNGVMTMADGQNREEHLELLRHQRHLLVTLQSEITVKRRHLAELDPGEFWTSRSQRAYSNQVDEVTQDLDATLHYLNAALDTVREQIRQEEHLCLA